MVAFVPLDSRHPSRPAFGVDDWGAENDGGRGSIARLVPGSPDVKPFGVAEHLTGGEAAVRIKEGGNPVKKSQANCFMG